MQSTRYKETYNY